jgi:hypothetical protein
MSKSQTAFLWVEGVDHIRLGHQTLFLFIFKLKLFKSLKS